MSQSQFVYYNLANDGEIVNKLTDSNNNAILKIDWWSWVRGVFC